MRVRLAHVDLLARAEDPAAADGVRQLTLLGAEAGERELELGALGAAGRVVEHGLVDGRGNLGHSVHGRHAPTARCTGRTRESRWSRVPPARTVGTVDVIFERVDARRYRIGATRGGRYDVGADVDVRPGPGGADLPHDLVHFVVEEQAGLGLGIYGQVAAGGDVGGFFRAGHPRTLAERRRSERVGRAGRHEVERSEQLAGLVAHDGSVRPHPELDERLRTAIETRLAGLVAAWRAVPAGGRLVLPWPEHLQPRHGRLPQERRPARDGSRRAQPVSGRRR